jgi:tol-pal system protein YbgF
MMSTEVAVIRRIPFVLLALALAGPAWAANKDMERLQIQVADLQRQLYDLVRMAEENQAEIRRLNEGLADQNDLMKRQLEGRRVQDESLQSALRDITERLSELGERVQALAAAPAAAPPVAGLPASPEAGPAGTLPPPVAAAGPGPPPRELYSQSYADYARGNYDLAIQGFTQYQRHPAAANDLVDNAQYWIGESQYGKKAYAEAIASWDALFRDYPASDKLPDARVKKGMALEKMGRRRDALREYRTVIDRYPNSPAARIARDHLNP